MDRKMYKQLCKLKKKQPFRQSADIDFNALLAKRLIKSIPGDSDGMGGHFDSGNYKLTDFAEREMRDFRLNRLNSRKSTITLIVLILTLLIGIATFLLAYLFPLLGIL